MVKKKVTKPKPKKAIVLVRPAKDQKINWWPKNNRGGYAWASIDYRGGDVCGYTIGIEPKYAVAASKAETVMVDWVESKVDGSTEEAYLKCADEWDFEVRDI